jgi:hypothetical protein
MLDGPSIVSNDGFFDGWFFVGHAALHGQLDGNGLVLNRQRQMPAAGNIA